MYDLSNSRFPNRSHIFLFVSRTHIEILVFRDRPEILNLLPLSARRGFLAKEPEPPGAMQAFPQNRPRASNWLFWSAQVLRGFAALCSFRREDDICRSP
jgi:hypothetical protein